MSLICWAWAPWKVRITYLCYHVHCIHAMFLRPVVPSCVESPLRCSNSFCSIRSPVPAKVPFSNAADSLILQVCPLSRDKALPPESFRAVLVRHRDIFGMSRTPKHLQVKHSLCVFLLLFLTLTTNSVWSDLASWCWCWECWWCSASFHAHCQGVFCWMFSQDRWRTLEKRKQWTLAL